MSQTFKRGDILASVLKAPKQTDNLGSRMAFVGVVLRSSKSEVSGNKYTITWNSISDDSDFAFEYIPPEGYELIKIGEVSPQNDVRFFNQFAESVVPSSSEFYVKNSSTSSGISLSANDTSPAATDMTFNEFIGALRVVKNEIK